ncbi:MAG TPA: RNase adapter RapZ, partial [Bacteroidales bacterium]|nr:RNase adapter RapZ [Bacteroidales bacterium]
FVFDCRFLPNPGRIPEYKEYNGTDLAIQQYFSQYEVVEQFKRSVEEIIIMAVDNYLEREFQQLMINFGCTGGQHRSIYFAEWLAKKLQERYPQVQINLNHIQFPELSKRFVPNQ